MLKLKTLMAGFRRPAVTRPLEERFTTVYREGSWNSDESASGVGSERGSGQVAHALDILGRMISDLNIRSISDLPCGDFNWMPQLLEAHPHIDYIGYDVVTPLILQNQQRHPDRTFAVLDITTEVPRRSDLIFSKDLLNHLNFDDVRAALENMVASGSPYMLVTNNRGFENEELEADVPNASRHLDLFSDPFRMPDALYADHYFVLWDRDAVIRGLQHKPA